MSYQLLVFDYRSLIKNITHAAVVKIRKNWNVYHRCLCYIFNHVDTSCPFGGLLTSMSIEFIILNILPWDSSLNSLAFVQILQYINCHLILYCTPAKFSITARKAFVFCCRLCQMCANSCQQKKQDDPLLWVPENWTTHPLPGARSP